MFKDSFKASGADIDKAIAPGDTVAWARSRLEAFDTQILKTAERIDKGRLGIPVYISRYTPQASRITGTQKQMGKGATPEQAEASAVMELVERFSIFSFVKDGTRSNQGKFTDIFADIAIDWDEFELLPIDEMLMAAGLKNESRCPEALAWLVSTAMSFKWTKALRPHDGKGFLLPWSWFWPINEYNGSAAGNSLEEAAVQAICEVVERHVCSIISRDKLETPTIDPGSLQNPVARELVRKFRETGIHLILKDFSLGLGIPTVGAIAWDPSTFPRRSEIVYTAGTSTSPERAAIRAITEIAQLAGDFDTEGRYVESGLPKFSVLEEADYILRAQSITPINALPDCSSKNFKTEIENAALALRKAGMNTYLIDVTHPDLGIPAVYAIIPGNHFRDRTIKIDPVFHCARLATLQEDHAEGLSVLHKIDHISSKGRYEVAFYIGHLLERSGRYDDALHWYDEAISRGPDPDELASIHCHKGFCLKEKGEFEMAAVELERSKGLNPELKETYNLLGYCFYRMGDYIKAIEAFEQAIAIDPGSAIDYANIGRNLHLLGMKKMAALWYEAALELDPDIVWAREQLSTI
ncbi:YcaO-like family protein [Dissulfurimicrobium hydrothermale]|uniref:YcaO-like family protein n=2 Tax=Dissulfurimicrobium TaxID=1769732 RepID=UPI001EDB5988|nr:YcaO-like family protein [Dissulfurimicrobium hydrothermale]UKL13030.1 YcaO-like family protein [Dissulfurimicrobium hydrothermale]